MRSTRWTLCIALLVIVFGHGPGGAHPVAGHVITGSLPGIPGLPGTVSTFTIVGATPTTMARNGVVVETVWRAGDDPGRLLNSRAWTINCLWIDAAPGSAIAHIAYLSLAGGARPNTGSSSTVVRAGRWICGIGRSIRVKGSVIPRFTRSSLPY